MAHDSVSDNHITEQAKKTLSLFEEYNELLSTGTYICEALEELNKQVDTLIHLANRYSEIAKKIYVEKP